MDEPERTDNARWIRSAVQAYEAPLLRYAGRLTGDEHSARDVVQETFLRLCGENPAKLDGHLAPWLYTVCRRLSIDTTRKAKKMKTLSTQKANAQEGREADAAHRAEQHDDARRVQQVLGQLSDNQQEVVRLKFQGGLSYREIAGVTELSVSNVGYLIHTAIKNVRQQLQGDSECAG